MRTIFCDETGDSGADVAAGASPLLVICAFICEDASHSARIAEKQESFRQEFSWRGELKWAKMRPEMRLEFMERLLPVIPEHLAIVWRKSRPLISPLSAPEGVLLNRCVQDLVGDNRKIRLVMDGERNRRRAAQLRLATGVSEVRIEPSHGSPCLQLADMLVGFHSSCAKGREPELPKRLHSLRHRRVEWS